MNWFYGEKKRRNTWLQCVVLSLAFSFLLKIQNRKKKLKKYTIKTNNKTLNKGNSVHTLVRMYDWERNYVGFVCCMSAFNSTWVFFSFRFFYFTFFVETIVNGLSHFVLLFSLSCMWPYQEHFQCPWVTNSNVYVCISPTCMEYDAHAWIIIA